MCPMVGAKDTGCRLSLAILCYEPSRKLNGVGTLGLVVCVMKLESKGSLCLPKYSETCSDACWGRRPTSVD